MPKIICKGAKNKGFGADAITAGMQIGGKTMARYIDAEKLKETVIADVWDGKVASDVVWIIDKQPTADVRENVHGEWKQKAWIDETMEVHEDILVTKCSECGMRTYWLKDEKLWKFCPNCGAQMDERRTE